MEACSQKIYQYLLPVENKAPFQHNRKSELATDRKRETSSLWGLCVLTCTLVTQEGVHFVKNHPAQCATRELLSLSACGVYKMSSERVKACNI